VSERDRLLSLLKELAYERRKVVLERDEPDGAPTASAPQY